MYNRIERFLARFYMHIPGRNNWIGYFVALFGIALVTAVYQLFFPAASAATIALSFLLIVLITSTIGGLAPGIVASIGGVLCYDYYFLPGIGKFVIEDAQDVVDFIVFLSTAVITSQLSAAARSRTREAEKSRNEVWQLYQLSCRIIAAPDYAAVASSITRQVREIFACDYCAILLAETSSWRQLTSTLTAAGDNFSPDTAEVARVLASGNPVYRELPAPGKSEQPSRMVSYVPLKQGAVINGAMVINGPFLEPASIDAIAGLVNLALERAHFLQEVSRTEALRQSDALKSALLASVSHNLRTPLTSIRASVDNLLQEDMAWDNASLQEFHLIISEETYRLTRLVQNLLEMARIDAGELKPFRQWVSVPDLVTEVLDRCYTVTRNHQVVVDIDEKLLPVQLDFRLIAEVLANLIENAAKYSPPGSRIDIGAVMNDNILTVSVMDRGDGIAPAELDQIFDKFYRGTRSKDSDGTGMGLAIARGIIDAHGGRIWAENRTGGGTTLCFTIPTESRDVSEMMLMEGAL